MTHNKEIVDMFKLYLYRMSADNGNTWTEQWMTENEAKEVKREGYIVIACDSRLFYKEI